VGPAAAGKLGGAAVNGHPRTDELLAPLKRQLFGVVQSLEVATALYARAWGVVFSLCVELEGKVRDENAVAVIAERLNQDLAEVRAALEETEKRRAWADERRLAAEHDAIGWRKETAKVNAELARAHKERDDALEVVVELEALRLTHAEEVERRRTAEHALFGARQEAASLNAELDQSAARMVTLSRERDAARHNHSQAMLDVGAEQQARTTAQRELKDLRAYVKVLEDGAKRRAEEDAVLVEARKLGLLRPEHEIRAIAAEAAAARKAG
jgi:chromosome segregation ATPase